MCEGKSCQHEMIIILQCLIGPLKMCGEKKVWLLSSEDSADEASSFCGVIGSRLKSSTTSQGFKSLRYL